MANKISESMPCTFLGALRFLVLFVELEIDSVRAFHVSLQQVLSNECCRGRWAKMAREGPDSGVTQFVAFAFILSQEPG